MGTSFLQIHKLKTKDDFIAYGALESCYQKCIDTITALPYYENHNIRANGVLAIHIYMRAELSEEMLTDWIRVNKIWANEYFTEPCQILDESTEQDEGFLIHNLYIIPVSPVGRVSYEHYCNSNYKLRLIQNTYADKMRLFFGLLRTAPSITKRSAKAGLYKPSDHPKSLSQMPKAKDFNDIKEYEMAVQRYMVDVQNYYETKLNKQTRSSDQNLLTENKYLKKENSKLSKFMNPYMQMIDEYGGPGKINKMLISAQMLQYAIRYYQENGDRQSANNVTQILSDGQQYKQRHNL